MINRGMLDATKNPGGLCDIYTEEALAAAAASADPSEGFVRTLEGINRLRKAHKPVTNKARLESLLYGIKGSILWNHPVLSSGVFFLGLRELQAGADDGGVRRGEGGRGHAGPQLLLRNPLRIQPGKRNPA